MHALPLTMACCHTDRTAALFAGEVRPAGIDLMLLDMWPHVTFHRMSRFGEFDAAEMSLSSFLIAKDRGAPDFVGLPVYLSRAFRHSSIYVRRDAGIQTAQDLRGKIIGVPEYQQTNALWVRGILQDYYGVAPWEMSWVQGGQEEAGREERLPITLPSNIRYTHVGDKSLNDMIAAGEIDAIVSPRRPLVAGRPIANVGRLFEDYKAEELRFYRDTTTFPIIHLVVMRGDVYRAHPWAAQHLYHALDDARGLWLRELRAKGHQRMGMPWVVSAIDETFGLMGENWWSYGLGAGNRRILETVCRYSHEQGLTSRQLGVDELFAPNTMEGLHT